jgi:hypothetical protein
MANFNTGLELIRRSLLLINMYTGQPIAIGILRRKNVFYIFIMYI